MRSNEDTIDSLLSKISLYKEERNLLLIFIKDLTVILKDESLKRKEDLIIISLLNIISSFAKILEKRYRLEDQKENNG